VLEESLDLRQRGDRQTFSDVKLQIHEDGRLNFKTEKNQILRLHLRLSFFDKVPPISIKTMSLDS